MTLKTFHFAGVASMNVTLGVPRLKEIVNAAKVISTPLIQVALRSSRSEPAARLVKGRLERTLLGSVCESISIVVAPRCAHVAVRLDLERCARLQLEIDARAVRAALLASKLKLKAENVRIADGDELLVTAPGDASGKVPLLNALQGLEAALPGVIVQGLATVARAVVRKEKDDGREVFSLVVEGTNLRAVLATPGVDGARTTSNHVAEVALYVGIEAARATVMKEIAYTMGQHGMAVDPRHIMLMADAMTHRGEVLGITRFGIAKMKDSVLMLASFEKTTDHLFDAALRGRVDDVTGVSESIIMGIPMPTGTGLFGILHKHTPKELSKMDESSLVPSPKPARASAPERCASAAARLVPLRQRPEPLLAGY
ncbi:domain 5 of RNA polymerase Rpb1 [Helicosporidium sp. ATCC 50920]|nr:domain 5 of RNA polymerase Rpb1 [Helicosporidium sp. ATCC 50920]|eukprot:KDD72848.1 domain 5 of RNA polymerase Rpb1 [Helicosporidium sp. ATCC 50920]